LLSNIVCFFVFAEEARALRLMKPANTSPERLDGLSLDRRHYFQQQRFLLFSYGGEPDTANENLRIKNLVELTGIEPVTSCLQSTRSPS
jgi:hypothetical protein